MSLQRQQTAANLTRKTLYRVAKGPTSTAILEFLPDWKQAERTWGWTWELHWLGLGSLFTVLALYALFSLYNKSQSVNCGRRNKHSTKAINTLVLTLGLSRALFLMVDPYASKIGLCKNCSVFLGRILFAIGFPCLTAAFSLIHLAFLQISKLKLRPNGLQSPKFLLSVISFHFGLVLVTEIFLHFCADSTSMIIVCQTFYILWSSMLSVSFLYSGRKIMHFVHESRQQIMALGSIAECRASKFRMWIHARLLVPKLVRVTFCTSLLGICCCALQIYAIFGLYNMYRTPHFAPNPWYWLTFQSLLRLVEFAAGCTIAYVGRPRAAGRRVSFTGCLVRINIIHCRFPTKTTPITTATSKRDNTYVPRTATSACRSISTSFIPSSFPSWWWI